MIIHWRSLFLLLTLPVFSMSTYYTIPEYIDFLTNSDGAYQQATTSIELVKYDYESVLGIQDWRMNHQVGSSHVSPFQTSAFTPSYINTFGTTFSLSRSILNTGGSVSFSMDNQQIKQPLVQFGSVSASTPLFYESAIDITYTQPLLAGFGGTELKLPIIQAS